MPRKDGWWWCKKYAEKDEGIWYIRVARVRTHGQTLWTFNIYLKDSPWDSILGHIRLTGIPGWTERKNAMKIADEQFALMIEARK